jgi:acyl-CoA thioesterase I
MKESKTTALSLITLLIVVIVSLLTYGRELRITNYPSENTGVVAFGDSLVEGVGATREGGFVSILSKRLGVPIVNLGRSGDTTALALERVEEVVALRPAVTIILLGGNDFFQGVSELEIINNLGMIIEAIQASGSAVILVGLESNTDGNHHRQIFDHLQRIHHTAYVMNVLNNIYGTGAFMSGDGIHPNDFGYELVAQRILPVLGAMLR